MTEFTSPGLNLSFSKPEASANPKISGLVTVMSKESNEYVPERRAVAMSSALM